MDEWPPLSISPDETAAERSTRLEAEMQAKKISEEIDHALDLERFERRRRKPATKILLLGECLRQGTHNQLYLAYIVPRSSRVG